MVLGCKEVCRGQESVPTPYEALSLPLLTQRYKENKRHPYMIHPSLNFSTEAYFRDILSHGMARNGSFETISLTSTQSYTIELCWPKLVLG
jgi:hypothetical protein